MAAVQLASAKESWDFWKAEGLDDIHAAVMLGDEQGETSFVYPAVGDNGEAHGLAQWHKVRRDAILAGTGIDVETADHLHQLEAVKWELTWGTYKHVWPLFLAATTIMDATRVIVSKYEQSGEQARDIARRSIMAAYWKGQLGSATMEGTKPLREWIDKAGDYVVERLLVPNFSDRVDLTAPRAGVLHTTEGGWAGSLAVFHKHYAPHFVVGKSNAGEPGGDVRVAQLAPIGVIGGACRAHNNKAIVQIEMVGFSQEELWRPDLETAKALIALMVVCRDEYGIPLVHPWPEDDWGHAGHNPHRRSGKFGTVAGWFGHQDMPDPDVHWDPGHLDWDWIFSLAKGVYDGRPDPDSHADPANSGQGTSSDS
jgi:hypothetical protein